jgi:antirestriction protein ArdC
MAKVLESAPERIQSQRAPQRNIRPSIPRFEPVDAISSRNGERVGAQWMDDVQPGPQSWRTAVFFWKFEEKEVQDDDTGKLKIKRIVTMRLYYVFNVDQVDGAKLPKRENGGPVDDGDDCEAFDVNAAAQGIADSYLANGGPSYANDGIDSAYYRPSQDSVHMPEAKQFDRPGSYYAVMFHELGHSTGHPERLGRFDLTKRLAAFGSDDYSKEELVAEFTSAFLAAQSGIDNTIDDSASYISHWLKVLHSDPKLAVAAAGQAQKAADLIMAAGKPAS